MILVGRKPVLEALNSKALTVERITIAASARGEFIAELRDLAERMGVRLDTAGDRRIDALAGDDRQHQGVVAHVEPPEPLSLAEFLVDRQGRDWTTNVLLLDHVHNPANVGMILRSAAGAGIHGVILPRQGTASIGPLTVKAGAGVVFSVPIIDVGSVEDALAGLHEEGFSLVGLDAGGDDLWSAELPGRGAYILGNETVGLSQASADSLDQVVSLPLSNGVESLNVAAAAAVLSYELRRRQSL